MRRRTHEQHYSKEISSPVGRLMLVCSDVAVSAVLWHTEANGRVPLPPRLPPVSTHPLLDKLEQQLAEYFRGERRTFELPLAPEGTPFQQQAWQALLRIPYGRTISYQEQAEQIGCSRKARAVGAANGRNPISIVIPCHRVVGKNGSLTGFAGGIELKRHLLNLESMHAGLAVY